MLGVTADYKRQVRRASAQRPSARCNGSSKRMEVAAQTARPRHASNGTTA